MKLQSNIKFTDAVALLFIGTLWGMNWPAVKFLLTFIQPLTMRAISFTAAACLLALIARFLNQPLHLPKGEVRPALLTGLFLIFGFNGLTTFGQLLVEASKATIIAYTMPSFTAILAAMYLRERMTFHVVAGLMISMFGLSILALEDFSSFISNPSGPAIMLLAALSWAIGNVGLKSREWALKPLPLTMWFFIFSSLAIWPLVFIFEPMTTQSWPDKMAIWVLIFHILGPMIICYLVWSVLVAKLPTTTATISVLIAPVVGVMSSAWLLEEPLNWQKFIALTAILLSISFVTFTGGSRAK